jgi:hypothetical protein
MPFWTNECVKNKSKKIVIKDNSRCRDAVTQTSRLQKQARFENEPLPNQPSIPTATSHFP